MTSDPVDYQDPITRALAAMEAALDEVRDADATYLRTEAKREALLTGGRLLGKLESLQLRLIATSADVADAEGARDVGSWLTAHTGTDHPANHASQRLAEDLDQRWRVVAAGLADGRVNPAQARVIVRSLNALDPEVGQDNLTKAESLLVELAADFAPKMLRRLGDKILEMIAPEVHEDAERRKLEAEHRRAQAQTRLNFRNRGDGTVDIDARVPEAVAARLKGYLEAFSSPRHDTSTPGEGLLDPATGKRLPAERIRGIAFCSFLESADPNRMPLHGGDATTCVITMNLKDLQRETGVATLGDGTPITPGEFRRLACTASIIPVVLGSDSEALDLGRTSRLYQRGARRALALKHPHCQAEGCTIPATWCEAHHRKAWAKGGRTDLKDGVLLCAWHHHRAHDPDYDVDYQPDGVVRFSRRMQ